jgi:predicted flap endonuclease-1-like 5' DNA nuclease
MKVVDIEGIGPAYADKLRGAGIDSADELLAATATAKGRQDLSDKTGISAKLLLEWANHVDLMRVDGVGSEYADLLEAAGVDSCPELAQRNPHNLAATLADLNRVKQLVRRVPTEEAVGGWVEQAKALPKVVTH